MILSHSWKILSHSWMIFKPKVTFATSPSKNTFYQISQTTTTTILVTTTMIKLLLPVTWLLAVTTHAYNNYNGGGSSSSSSSSYNGDAYGHNFFADTDISYYDGYQQAWRYLGWYVKCGSPSDRYDDSGEEHSHSGSQDNNDDFLVGSNWCQRYLIWAAVSGLFLYWW